MSVLKQPENVFDLLFESLVGRPIYQQIKDIIFYAFLASFKGMLHAFGIRPA